MKNLLFMLFLTLFIFSCQTSYDNERKVGDFSNYYEQYQNKAKDKELLSQVPENDSVQIKATEFVIN